MIDKNYILSNIDIILDDYKIYSILENLIYTNISKRIGIYISEIVIRNICNYYINDFNQQVEDECYNKIRDYLIDKFGTLENALFYMKLPICCKYWKIEDDKVCFNYYVNDEDKIVIILKYILTGILDEDYAVIYKENEDLINFLRRENGLKSFNIGGKSIVIRSYKNGKIIIKGLNTEQLNKLNSIINFINNNHQVFHTLKK